MERILLGKPGMQPRLAILEPIASAVTIGTGGPFGADRPIIMSGGALDSIAGQLLRLAASDRRAHRVARGGGDERGLRCASPGDAFRRRAPRLRVPVPLDGAVRTRGRRRRWPTDGNGGGGPIAVQPIFPLSPHAPARGVELVVAAIVGLATGHAASVTTQAGRIAPAARQRSSSTAVAAST